jgi:hypothetical protein
MQLIDTKKQTTKRDDKKVNCTENLPHANLPIRNLTSRPSVEFMCHSAHTSVKKGLQSVTIDHKVLLKFAL